MKGTQPILTLALDSDAAVALVKLCLLEKGIYAQQNFELTSACATFTDPACPHQPDQRCDCHLVTLQIKGSNFPTFPLIFHSHDAYTEIFYLEENTISSEVMFAVQQAKL